MSKTKAKPKKVPGGSRITTLYNHLAARAVSTGRDARADLGGGARLAVRCSVGVLGIRRMTLTIARRGARVGTTEEVTFRQHCGVPVGATRHPADPALQQIRDSDDGRWWLIGYSWYEGAQQQEVA